MFHRVVPVTALGCALVFVACETSEDPFAYEGTDARRDIGAADTSGQNDTGTSATDTGGTVELVDCPTDVVFTGQVFGDDEDPLSPNGGAPRFEAWGADYDAGIQAMVQATPSGEEPVTGEWSFTEATVIATDYNSEATQRAQRSFWLGDGNAAIQVFFYAEDTDSPPDFSVRVGQRISGTATSLGSYRGIAQVQTADGGAWQLVSEDNEVYIRDVDGPLTFDDVNTVVRVTGNAASIESPDCGGSVCYEFTYGDGEAVTLRSESDYIEVGGCLTFVGPVRGFDGDAQLDTLNFDWIWTYDAE